jgi:hypothetical protein
MVKSTSYLLFLRVSKKEEEGLFQKYVSRRSRKEVAKQGY